MMRKRHTRSDAFPDIYAFPSGIPDSTLRVDGPVDVELPDARGIADKTGHG